jgi:RHS repeat-associated protein
MPGDYQVDYVRSLAGRMTEVVTAEDSTVFTYDGAGLQLSESWGQGSWQDIENSRDAYGRVDGWVWTGATGQTRSAAITRDVAGRVTQQILTQGSTDLSTHVANLDANGNPIWTWNEVNGAVQVEHEWDYDALGQPTRRDTNFGSTAAGGTDWTYYANGQLESITMPSGRLVEYHRSNAGADFLLDTVTVDGFLVAGISRDTFNRPQGITTPGYALAIGYDVMGRVASSTTLPVAGSTWTASAWTGVYDDRGRLESETIHDGLTGAWTNDYAYTEPGWLVEEDRGRTGEVREYVYDAGGRRTDTLVDGVGSSIGWDGNLATDVDGTAVTYDDWDGVDTDQHGYSYDRLPDGSVDAIWDGSTMVNEFTRGPDARVWATDEGGTLDRWTFWNASAETLPLEVANADGTDETYVVVEGVFLGTWDGNFDPRWSGGREDVLRDETDSLEADSTFGGHDGVSVPDERFLHAGLEFLPNAPEVGLSQSRLYDSETGRFLSPDPIGLAGGLHRTRYVGGDPVNFMDPSGHAYKGTNQPSGPGALVGQVRGNSVPRLIEEIARPAGPDFGALSIRDRQFYEESKTGFWKQLAGCLSSRDCRAFDPRDLTTLGRTVGQTRAEVWREKRAMRMEARRVKHRSWVTKAWGRFDWLLKQRCPSCGWRESSAELQIVSNADSPDGEVKATLVVAPSEWSRADWYEDWLALGDPSNPYNGQVVAVPISDLIPQFLVVKSGFGAFLASDAHRYGWLLNSVNEKAATDSDAGAVIRDFQKFMVYADDAGVTAGVVAGIRSIPPPSSSMNSNQALPSSVVDDAVLTADAKHIPGNSKMSPRRQHMCEISRVVGGDVGKTGISGQPLNKNGTSPRANRQVKKLNREAGGNVWKAEVVAKDIPGRAMALEMEQLNTNRLYDQGHSMELHSRPKPQGR